jgi:hypothetical protein
MASSSRIEIEKFNGQNFELWKLKMEDLLVDREQWTTVCPGTHADRYVDGRMGETRKKSKKYDSTLSCRFNVVECLR